jgi:hypothetical protein
MRTTAMHPDAAMDMVLARIGAVTVILAHEVKN